MGEGRESRRRRGRVGWWGRTHCSHEGGSASQADKWWEDRVEEEEGQEGGGQFS